MKYLLALGVLCIVVLSWLGVTSNSQPPVPLSPGCTPSGWLDDPCFASLKAREERNQR
jgi:hypothetical protein